MGHANHTEDRYSPLFEQDPRYPLAMLKISFELRDKSDPKFEEIFFQLLNNSEFSNHDFQRYLDEYRDNLRTNCQKKGIA